MWCDADQQFGSKDWKRIRQPRLCGTYCTAGKRGRSAGDVDDHYRSKDTEKSD